MTARKGPKNHLGTDEVLEAVSVLGIRWTMAFSDEEVITVNEALDRELVNGNLANAFTVSAQGLQRLRESGRRRSEARIEVRIDTTCRRCRLGDECWVVRCTRCDGLQVRHVVEPDLVPTVREAFATHTCALADSPLRVRAPREPAAVVASAG